LELPAFVQWEDYSNVCGEVEQQSSTMAEEAKVTRLEDVLGNLRATKER